MTEAARCIRVSRRALQSIIQRYPLYYMNGNRKLFTEGDLVALTEAMRCSNSSKGTTVPTGISVALSGDKALTKALALVTGGPQKKSASRGKRSY